MDFTGYMTIPYRDGGRDRSGCDCWGLARLVLAERFGRAVPSFDGHDADDVASLALGSTFVPVDAPRPGDIALFMRHMKPAHAGVYLGGRHVIHMERRAGVCVESLDGPRLRGRLEGFYRA